MNKLTSTQRIISLILKTVIVLSVLIGVIMGALASEANFMGGDTVFMYFTIQSNILIGLICLIGAILIITNRYENKVWYIIKYIGTVSITLTGVVFCFVLAPGMGANAWNLVNVLTHVVVPVVSVIDFFVICTVTKIKKINALWVTVPPLLYAFYAGIGYVNNWQFFEGYNYPYFFLNWGSEAGAAGFSDKPPFMGPVWWILILLVFLIIIGLVYLLIADLITKKVNKTK
ncbi:MAG: Pr6Pr family membrane protein [Lachnospiraceae bacterium]|nr:Pr6Pr family membrane protein [Lachnospiraceae bacterium]